MCLFRCGGFIVVGCGSFGGGVGLGKGGIVFCGVMYRGWFFVFILFVSLMFFVVFRG